MNPLYTWLTPVLTIAATAAIFLLLMPDETSPLFWVNLGYTVVLESVFFGWWLWGRPRRQTK